MNSLRLGVYSSGESTSRKSFIFVVTSADQPITTVIAEWHFTRLVSADECLISSSLMARHDTAGKVFSCWFLCVTVYCWRTDSLLLPRLSLLIHGSPVTLLPAWFTLIALVYGPNVYISCVQHLESFTAFVWLFIIPVVTLNQFALALGATHTCVFALSNSNSHQSSIKNLV